MSLDVPSIICRTKIKKRTTTSAKPVRNGGREEDSKSLFSDYRTSWGPGKRKRASSKGKGIIPTERGAAIAPPNTEVRTKGMVFRPKKKKRETTQQRRLREKKKEDGFFPSER